MKTCPRCGRPHERRHYYCADCFRTYMRDWREHHESPAALRAKVDRLMRALEPFQRRIEEPSLSEALGHIDREHLEDARRAYDDIQRHRAVTMTNVSHETMLRS